MDTLSALEHAVFPKQRPGWENRGLPSVLYYLASADLSGWCRGQLRKRGITVVQTAPARPWPGQLTEQWFRYLDRMLLRSLPGHLKKAGRSAADAEHAVNGLLRCRELGREIAR